MATPAAGGHGGLRSDRRKTAAEQAVRKQVARELHDRVAQTLTGMLVDVENFKAQEVAWEDVIRQMETVQSSTRQVLASLRQLLHDLRGEDPLGESFADALHTLAARFEAKTRIAVRLDVQPGWADGLTPPASLNVYRIVEEALANVRMHSGARNVHILLRCKTDDELSMLIVDDGRGLDTDASRPVGLGTVGMKERAVLLGGQLKIESGEGVGTGVHAIFPRLQLTPNREPSAPGELTTQELIMQGA